MAQYDAIGTTETEQMLHSRIANTFVLPKGMLVVASEDDWAAMSSMKSVGLNLVTLPREILYQLLDEVITELHTQEGRAIQVLHEQKNHMDQLSIQWDEWVAQAHGLE